MRSVALAVLVVLGVLVFASVGQAQEIEVVDTVYPTVEHAGATIDLHVRKSEGGDDDVRFGAFYNFEPTSLEPKPWFHFDGVVRSPQPNSTPPEYQTAELLIEGRLVLSESLTAFWSLTGRGSLSFSGPTISQSGATGPGGWVISSNGSVFLPPGEYNLRVNQVSPSAFNFNGWSNAIPEPSTWALAAVGTLGLFILRRHRRHSG
jgi:hypothetical protein